MLERILNKLGYVKLPKDIPEGYHLVPPHVSKNKPKKSLVNAGDAANTGASTSLDGGDTEVDTVSPSVKPLPGQIDMSAFLDED